MPTYAFWAAVAACAVAQLFIIAGAVRTGEFRQSEYSIPRPSRWSEIGWTILPALGLAVVLALTYHAVSRAPEPVPASASGQMGTSP